MNLKPSIILLVSLMIMDLVCPYEQLHGATPEITRVDMVVPRLTIRGNQGATNVIEYAEVVSTNQWLTLTNLVVANSPYTMLDLAEQKAQRFYRATLSAGQEINQDAPSLDITMAPRLTIQSDPGVTNLIEYAEDLPTNRWLTLTNLVVTNTPYTVVDMTAPSTPRFYRVSVPGVTEIATETNAPDGMVLIPSGSFKMGDTFGEGHNDERPIHKVQVSAFYMDKYEVAKGLWDEVKIWSVAHGYKYENAGMGIDTNYPVHSVTWYDAVKWCNARSEKMGLVPAYYTDVTRTIVYRTGQVNVQNDWVKWNMGYRLPTEAEWEKAARGGVSGHRFPWSDVDTITHSMANYYSSGDYFYDISSTRDYHPSYISNVLPYTSPVGSFAPNGYGLYDMAGNVCEWCWDMNGSFSSASQIDYHGSSSGSYRVFRGGSWGSSAFYARVACRYVLQPDNGLYIIGFRSILPSGN